MLNKLGQGLDGRGEMLLKIANEQVEVLCCLVGFLVTLVSSRFQFGQVVEQNLNTDLQPS